MKVKYNKLCAWVALPLCCVSVKAETPSTDTQVSTAAKYWAYRNKRKQDLSKQPVAIPFSVITACIEAEAKELREQYLPLLVELHISTKDFEVIVSGYRADLMNLFTGLAQGDGHYVLTSQYQLQDILDEQRKVVEKQIKQHKQEAQHRHHYPEGSYVAHRPGSREATGSWWLFNLRWWGSR